MHQEKSGNPAKELRFRGFRSRGKKNSAEIFFFGQMFLDFLAFHHLLRRLSVKLFSP
jgi:hypothetical protein